MGCMSDKAIEAMETPIMIPCPDCFGDGTIEVEYPRYRGPSRDVGVIDVETETCETCSGDGEMERLCDCGEIVTLGMGHNMMEDDKMCMKYTLERLGDIKTQTDLDEFKDEIRNDLEVNSQWRSVNDYNPNISEVIEPDDFDVYRAIDDVKRNYIERALTRSKNIGEASKMLGVRNYQTLQNWIVKLGVDY